MARHQLCIIIIIIYPNMQDFFVQTCKVQPQPDVDDYIKLLVHITSTTPFQNALGDVLKIFSIIGQEVAKTSFEVEKFKFDLKERNVIPSKAKKWINFDCNPLIADDKQLEKMFLLDSGVHFVDCGEKLGITDKRQMKSEMDTIKIDSIHAFLTTFGIKRLTECVRCESATESYMDCPKLQLYVRSLLLYIQKLIFTEFPKIHEYLVKNIGIKQKLAVMQFASVAKLELVYTLANVPSVRPVVLSEKCRLVDNKVMYVHMDHIASYSDINKELARYFSRYGLSCLPDLKEESERCFKELKLFLVEIHPLIQKKSRELDSFLDDHNLMDLPETEEIWEIPEPKVVIEKKVPTECREKENEKMLKKSDDLRCWPPLSNCNSVVTGSKLPVKHVGLPQIWPPPARPQHQQTDMQEVVEIKARNIKVHGDEKKDTAKFKNSSKCETENVKGVSMCETDMQEVVETSAKDHTAEIVQETGILKKNDQKQSSNVVDETTISAAQAQQPSFDCTYNPLVIEFNLNKTQRKAARKSDKRARINNSASELDSLKSTEKHQITSHFYGPPVWLAETYENVLEQVGTADNLDLPSELMITDSSDLLAIGKWGEQLVKNFLEKSQCQANSNITSVEHINSTSESGLPYDFIIHNIDGKKIYLEVKTTISNSKACFDISIKQLMFALEQGAAYHLYRVFCAGDTNNVRISKIENLADKLFKKCVRLMMII